MGRAHEQPIDNEDRSNVYEDVTVDTRIRRFCRPAVAGYVASASPRSAGVLQKWFVSHAVPTQTINSADEDFHDLELRLRTQ
jgi:hypothetical protein